ncbi:MAG TPA: hypothetical protein VG826_11660 [Pirellulales bacterium]|nr:hypothetical protein [Pirellulales bacterium]
MLRRVLVAAILAAISGQGASAATGTVVSSAANGLSLTISTQWLDSGGYRPVRVTVAPLAPSKADQTVHLEFHGYNYFYPSSREITVAQDIEIPAGSTQVSQTIPVPQLFPLQNFKVEVWVDGRYRPKLSLTSFAGAMSNEGLPNVLVVAKPTPAGAPPPLGASTLAADPDSSLLASVFPADVVTMQQAYWGAPTAPVGTGPPPLQTLITLPSNYLPRRWIELSCLDIICISVDELEQLFTAEPEQFQALRDWTMAGGNLIVFNVGAQFEPLATLSKRLAGHSDPDETVWTRPKPDDYRDQLSGPYNTYTQVTLVAAPMPQDAPFMLRPLGTGMVVAAATDDLFKQPAQHWVWMLNSLGSDRWLWYRRHGLSLQRRNGDFWNWLVRGVGLAPVTEFRVLITGFVLAIGPLNYFWLRRRGKLHLLVLIVPLAAVTVTFGLFSYAIMADGLDVRVRARTYTQIDQRAGQAVSWSRISYYAGLAPAGGLVFPDDLIAVPLTSNDGDVNNMPYHQNLVWSAGKQELVSGWVPSRTPTQYLTVRSRRSQAGLRFVPPGGQKGAQIENQLGTRVVRLLVADDQGRHYGGADIAAGARASLKPVDPGDGRSAIQELVNDRKPGVPQGFVPPSESTFRGRVRYYGSATSGAVPGASLGTSRLETCLRDATMGADRQASKADRAQLAPRTYIAVVERSPEVVFGVDEPREEDSLHVIVGSW